MKKIFSLLLLFTCIEAASQTFGLHYGNKDIAAILYVISGVLIGVLPLIKTKKEDFFNLERPIFVNWGAFFIIAIAVWMLGSSLFLAQPLDYKLADMLPIIQIMGERWLDGQEVYAIIPEIWNGMQPIYLPTMWMPYAAMVAIGVDIRLMSLLFILLAVFLTLDLPAFRQKKAVASFLVLIPLLIVLSYIFIDYSTFITITEEPIVVGFYMLLGYALIKNKPILIAAALSFCFLSRYALLFWAVTYLVYTFVHTSRRQALIIGIGTGVLSLFLLYISQGIEQLELFYSLKDAYLETLNNPDKIAGVLNITEKNIGLARFFSPESLPTLHTALFWGSLIIPPILYVWYHHKGRQWIAPQWFALCSLKLSLVWFFNMNAMPYSYLFYTSTFLSLIILGQYISSVRHENI